jgi:hypothetical protein
MNKPGHVAAWYVWRWTSVVGTAVAPYWGGTEPVLTAQTVDCDRSWGPPPVYVSVPIAVVRASCGRSPPVGWERLTTAMHIAKKTRNCQWLSIMETEASKALILQFCSICFFTWSTGLVGNSSIQFKLFISTFYSVAKFILRHRLLLWWKKLFSR